jgi:hypothetical protein
MGNRNNVTDISQAVRPHGGNSAGSRAPLNECKEIAILRLGVALNESFERMVEQLLEMADKAVGLEMYHLHMDALDLVRNRSEAIGATFRERFLWNFNRACRHEGSKPSENSNVRLSLVEPDELEDSLAVGTLSNAIFNTCSEELFALDRRMGMLINDPELEQGENPLGPGVIGKAIMEALEEGEQQIKVRLLVVSLLSKLLPLRMPDIYREINRKLVERNVLPTILVGMKRKEQINISLSGPGGVSASGGASGQAGGGGAGAGTAAQGATTVSGDLFEVMQRLMMSGAGGAGQGYPGQPYMPGAPGGSGGTTAGGAGFGAGQPVLGGGPSPAFMTALHQLQRGQFGNVPSAGNAASPFGSDPASVLRNLRSSEAAKSMNSLDAITLDIVSMVFDSILDDERITDDVKTLIVRLQIPMLKVAMLDKGFFSHKHHPARLFLDSLAEAAIGWDADGARKDELYPKLEKLVTEILDGFEENFDIFERLTGELKGWLDEEKRDADKTAVRSALALKSREEVDFSRLVAYDEIESCIVGRPVPGLIRTFLNKHWATLLVRMYQHEGADGEGWRSAVQTMKDLVWSVSPKGDAESRTRMLKMLPGLLKELRKGARDLDIDQETRDAFFTDLVKCHTVALKSSSYNEALNVAAEIEAKSDEPVEVPEPPTDFEPVEPVEEVDGPADARIFKHELDWNETAMPSMSDPVLAGIKRGSWIAYRNEKDIEVRAKLTWISPLNGCYLFTNRKGERAVSIGSDALASKLNAGEVRLLSSIPLMDRVIDGLMERLKSNAPA